MKKLIVIISLLALTAFAAVDLAVTEVSGFISLGSIPEFCYFKNTGDSPIYFVFGERRDPTINDFPVLPGDVVSFEDPTFLIVSFNCASGDTSTISWGVTP